MPDALRNDHKAMVFLCPDLTIVRMGGKSEMRMYSEREYDHPEMWFTGKEWEDGTAASVYGEMYRAREREFKINPPPRQKNKKFIKWFSYSLDQTA